MKTSNNVLMKINVVLIVMMITLQVEVLYVLLLQKEVIVQPLPPPPPNRNDLMKPRADEITALYLHVSVINDAQPLPLEHCPLLDLFYYNPEDVRDFLMGYRYLDVGILQVWCT